MRVYPNRDGTERFRFSEKRHVSLGNYGEVIPTPPPIGRLRNPTHLSGEQAHVTRLRSDEAGEQHSGRFDGEARCSDEVVEEVLRKNNCNGHRSLVLRTPFQHFADKSKKTLVRINARAPL